MSVYVLIEITQLLADIYRFAVVIFQLSLNNEPCSVCWIASHSDYIDINNTENKNYNKHRVNCA